MWGFFLSRFGAALRRVSGKQIVCEAAHASVCTVNREKRGNCCCCSGDRVNNLRDFPQLLMRAGMKTKSAAKKRKFCADSRGVHQRDISLIFPTSMLAAKIRFRYRTRHVLHFTCCYSSETGFPCISLECARFEGEKQSFTLAERFSFRRVGRRKKSSRHGEGRLLNFIVRSILDIHFPSLPAQFSLSVTKMCCQPTRLLGFMLAFIYFD